MGRRAKGYKTAMSLSTRKPTAADTAYAEGFLDLEVIIGQSAAWLVANGLLICEHGNMHRAAALRVAQDSLFSDVQDLDDMFGNPRFLIAKR